MKKTFDIPKIHVSVFEKENIAAAASFPTAADRVDAQLDTYAENEDITLSSSVALIF